MEPFERASSREQLEAPSLAPEVDLGLRFLIVDGSGSPLAGASVHVRHERGTELLVRTGPDGRARAELALPPPFELLGSLPGRASARRWCEDRPEGETTLVLGEGLGLEGVVERVGGGTTPAGIQVAAVPERTYLSAFRRSHVDWLADPEVVSTAPDALGGFRLEGLQAGVTYRVLAGGGGYVETRVTKARPADEAFLRLEVARLHAAWLRYVEPDFRPARVGEGVVASNPVTISVQKSQGALVPMSLAVAMALPALELRALPPGEQLIFVVAAGDAPEVGPVFVKGTLPGYAQIDQRILLPPIDELGGPLDVVVTSVAEGWGELELCLASEGPALETGPVVAPWAVVSLRGEGRGDVFQWPVRGALHGCHKLGPLPAGRYRIEVHGQPIDWSRVPREGATLEVVPGATTLATLDMSGLASASLLVQAQDQPLAGALHVDIWLEDEGQEHGGTVIFESPPYRVPALLPGKYSFCVRAPRCDDPWRKSDLASDQDAQVSWVLANAGRPAGSPLLKD